MICCGDCGKKKSPLYVIHAASRTAIVTHIIVLIENWIKQYVFSPFFCVKTPKEAGCGEDAE